MSTTITRPDSPTPAARTPEAPTPQSRVRRAARAVKSVLNEMAVAREVGQGRRR